MSTSLWTERPIEQARLLNPAFLASLIWACADGYGSVNEQGMPYPLLFVAMPVILHKVTRENLPRSISTSLAAWIGENSHVHIRFTERAISLVPLLKEGVLFGANGQIIEVSNSFIIAAPRPRTMTRFLAQSSNEVRTCMLKAKFVGKWFASNGDYVTVMALWGVAP